MKTAKKIIAVIMILSMTLALGQGMESKSAQAESYQSATTINLNGGWTVRRHIVGGTYRTLISVQNPLRLCRTGICRSLSAG